MSNSEDFGDETSNDYTHRLSKSNLDERPKQEVKEGSYTIITKPFDEQFVIRVIDGEERLCFEFFTNSIYNAINLESDYEEEIYDFALRFDLESVDITKLDDKFKDENCIYPRANCEKEKYNGNSWVYETVCNRLGWQFVSLNPELMYDKRGLIQRAVDIHRFITRENNIKIQRDEIVYGVVRTKYIYITPVFVPICWANNGSITECKARIDIEYVDYDKIDNDFKAKYSIYNNKFDGTTSKSIKQKKHCNELAVKIAYLNKDNIAFWNAVNTTDFATIIHKVAVACKKTCGNFRNRHKTLEAFESDETVTSKYN